LVKAKKIYKTNPKVRGSTPKRSPINQDALSIDIKRDKSPDKVIFEENFETEEKKAEE